MAERDMLMLPNERIDYIGRANAGQPNKQITLVSLVILTMQYEGTLFEHYTPDS